MATQFSTQQLPSRQSTNLTSASTFSDEAVPDADPTSTAGLLAERLQAWKHVCGFLEEYIGAVEKSHKEQAKEYEKVLKTISKPLREGQHFDPNLGGISGFFENMRTNTQALINTNLETEKNIKGSVLPVLDRLHKEIKNKAKELQQGAQKGAKEVEKARQTTQKHIELLGHQSAAFEAMGGKMGPQEDPYVLHRGVLHRLHHQVVEENNHRNDLLSVQSNMETFEAHVLLVLQQAMEAFHQYVGGQAERVNALYSDMLSTVQQIPADFEWKGFSERNRDILVDARDAPRDVAQITFPNQNHQSTSPVIEGSLERKSRNKLSWGFQAGYYVVTPSRYLHEFRDSDNVRKDPVPELSIYLPDATVSSPQGDKFTIKGKDRSKSVSSKLTGTSELHFKAHSPDDAEKWFYIIRDIAAAGPSHGVDSMPTSPTLASPTPGNMSRIASGGSFKAASPSPASPASVVSTGVTGGALASKGQEAGVTSGSSAKAALPPATVAAQTAVENASKATSA
ncbi:PH domain containing protein [Grosmannia clavigera kw1407]|uniref:PH domain containing protein n=1 Tax=Grosmannia clavigera (strain kw1407 / UAMH 11150) TaxID=655863 RepID=F0XGB5_GROCL|nr:PH domain containing protein [Grosmannia clavigera kw1407]EFX03325.1 PH domain containing protein [Grosmannia clavigera kw1407]